MKRPLRWFVAAVLGLPMTGALAAQEPIDERLRVFIDCSYFCDMDFLRTEIDWIDHMRDRADAHVHVLVTRQQTGGGGFEFTLEFIGLRQFEGRSDTLQHVSTADDTQDVIRRGLARVIKIGLVPFVAQTPLGRQLEITIPSQPGAPGAAGTTSNSEQNDPWNFWAFTIGLNGYAFGESQANSGRFSGNLTANRTTEAWKINTRLSGSYYEQTFEYTIDDVVTRTVSIRRSYDGSTLLVKSLSPHLSIGGRASAGTSTYGNTSLTFALTPAIEYNLFPYAQSTRRAFTVQYASGVRYADYREVTIFDELEETRPIHTINVVYTTRQPWGSISVGIDALQYLHDRSKYSTGASGGVNLRLFRGFSLNVDGYYRRVRDQLHIPARGLTEEEILLRQRQLATAYSFGVFFGVSYRFGSIFNNVVNSRFASAGGITFIE